MTKLRALNQPQPLAKMAYQALLESILNGHMSPGETYNEMALAKELNISRTPVREALLELSTRGLVTFLPRKGVEVNRFTQEDAKEIFQVRKAIELFCVERAAEVAAGLDLEPIARILERQTQALAGNDMRAFITGDRDFHTAFAEIVGNRRFLSILENMRDQIQIMALEALQRPDRGQEVMAEHGRVLEEVRRGNVKGAREALALHLDKSREAVLDGISGEEKR